MQQKKSICLPYNKYHFADLEEPHPIPLPVINAANDQNEGKQEDESHKEGEPKENSSGLADAIETPEQDIEAEPLLEGKSNSLLTRKILPELSYEFHLISKKFSLLTQWFTLHISSMQQISFYISQNRLSRIHLASTIMIMFLFFIYEIVSK